MTLKYEYMADILYDIVIEPIVLIISIAFSALYRYLGTPGPALIGVSLVVNVLSLPLYRMADANQEKERIRQEEMSLWVDHIKKHFKGDEQYMLLSTYYRQVGYKPIQALRGSFSLLLQIPIFMAAYNYLSHCSLLEGRSFGPIADLSTPDAMLTIAGTAINVLPVLMTLLNFASTAIYTKGLPLKDKIQPYVLAVLFLVLLYNSPSGLVLYWTCNQIFSLLKNVVMKIIEPLLARKRTHEDVTPTKDAVPTTAIFIAAAVLLAVLVGFRIPSALFGAAPLDWIDASDFVSPFAYIQHSFCVALGFFVLWVGIFFYLSGHHGRKLIAICMCLLAGVAITDYFFFGQDLGIVTSSLAFEKDFGFSPNEIWHNRIALVAVAIALVLIWKFANKIIIPALVIALEAIIGVSVPDLQNISFVIDEISDELTPHAEEPSYNEEFYNTDHTVKKLIHFSKTEKNVAVIFLDRFEGQYLPFLLHEKPELAQAYDGFTFYPNTLSSGGRTIFGTPTLYGGYDYTIDNMNARSDELMVDKHNEALLVMPSIFSEHNYNVSIFNAPAVDYLYYNNDYSLFDGLNNTEAHYIGSALTPSYDASFKQIADANLRYSLCMYDFMKIMPVRLQHLIYDNALYWTTLANHGINSSYAADYAALYQLDELTEINDTNTGGMLLFGSMLPHDQTVLQLPNYENKNFLDNSAFESSSRQDGLGHLIVFDTWAKEAQYHVSMSSLLVLSRWLDYLKAEDIYDNTRIIVASDHGYQLKQFDYNLIHDFAEQLPYGDPYFDPGEANPILLFKDFNSSGPLQTDESFMTNADTPVLATKDLIENPTNPFTKNPISYDGKEKPFYVTDSWLWETENHQGTTYNMSDGTLFSFQGQDIFDSNNWEIVEVYKQ